MEHRVRATRDESHDEAREGSSGGAPRGARAALGLERAIGNQAFVQLLQKQGLISRRGDVHEQEADRIAGTVMGGSSPDAVGPVPATPPAGTADSAGARADIESSLARLGGGSPLPGDVRSFMEPRFGEDFADVRVHTGQGAVEMNAGLQAEAFTYGSDIYYGAGRAPGADALTAHELSHVVQQTGAGAGKIDAKRIQPSFTGSYPVTHGVFEIDWQTLEGGVATPPTHSGFDGYIRFVPHPDAPNANQIVFIQIAKLTDLGKADVNAATDPAAQAPRGALGQPGIRTQDDAARGIEGGFGTDVYHRKDSTATGVATGTPLSPDYQFQPATSGTTGIGQTQQPAVYGGGIGGVVGQTPGFKRSSDAGDMRAAAMYDRPGAASSGLNVDFEFESVAKGEDTMLVYGSVKWGFGLRAGKVVNEHLTAVDAQSATFDEALERHRDFYVHEPVTFYFDFDSDAFKPSEASKIDSFLPYLTRNPTARLSLEGLADIRGGSSRHNSDLSLRRAEAVRDAIVAKGVDAGRIDDIVIGSGASTAATTDAGTGDQGGDAAVARDQDREANRWANRRVLLTFSIPPPGAAPAPAAGARP